MIRCVPKPLQYTALVIEIVVSLNELWIITSVNFTFCLTQLLTNIRVCLSDINETVFQYREESEESEDSEVSEDSITKIECSSKPMEKKGIIKKSVQPKISLNQRLSKIEMMIESGYYDRKEEQEGSERCMSFQPPQEQDWVSFYVPGGVISSEDCKPVNFCSVYQILMKA
jgi:hypothetical protein